MRVFLLLRLPAVLTLPIFAGMKRNALLAGLVTSLLYAGLTTLPFPAKAQDAATTAEREEREANYKRMLLKVEGLEETLQAQTKLITSLASKVNTLRDDLDRLKSREDSSATQEAFKRLAEKIEEVDRKRLADSERIAKQLKDLSRGMAKMSDPAPAPSTPKQAPKEPTEKPGFTYQIKNGDTLSRIVKELNAQGFKVTQKQIMDANAGVNWGKLQIGQTVIVPAPAP